MLTSFLLCSSEAFQLLLLAFLFMFVRVCVQWGTSMDDEGPVFVLWCKVGCLSEEEGEDGWRR